jgi:hypothetical protein
MIKALTDIAIDINNIRQVWHEKYEYITSLIPAEKSYVTIQIYNKENTSPTHYAKFTKEVELPMTFIDWDLTYSDEIGNMYSYETSNGQTYHTFLCKNNNDQIANIVNSVKPIRNKIQYIYQTKGSSLAWHTDDDSTGTRMHIVLKSNRSANIMTKEQKYYFPAESIYTIETNTTLHRVPKQCGERLHLTTNIL